MEKYIINGIEVEYDTFDLVNMELYDSEVRRISQAALEMENADESDYLHTVRSMCEDIMDSFDVLIGEGTAAKLFGGKVNAKTIPMAWRTFIREVADNMNDIGTENTAPMNREQRRAAERAKRKEEARLRVAQRHET